MVDPHLFWPDKPIGHTHRVVGPILLIGFSAGRNGFRLGSFCRAQILEVAPEFLNIELNLFYQVTFGFTGFGFWSFSGVVNGPVDVSLEFLVGGSVLGVLHIVAQGERVLS